jgi:hypothetical protein
MFDIAVMGMALIGATQAGQSYNFDAPGAVNYSVFVPFNSSEYFHPYCVMDYSNETSCQTVQTPFDERELISVLVWRR